MRGGDEEKKKKKKRKKTQREIFPTLNYVASVNTINLKHTQSEAFDTFWEVMATNKRVQKCPEGLVCSYRFASNFLVNGAVVNNSSVAPYRQRAARNLQ